jgi:RNA polymerase sigma-70 factor (ECF subfamily)
VRREERTARAREFEELRPLLFAIAYRITGSVAGAGDAVRETWLRYETAPARPEAPKALLSAVVTRVAVEVLRSARPRWERSHDAAAFAPLERLSPLERAVFVLCDVFGFGFDEIAAAVERSPEACRELAVRARGHMEDGEQAR